jgi:hypothetical protein
MPKFNYTKLSKEEKEVFRRFKIKKGQNRFNEWEKITEIIFPQQEIKSKKIEGNRQIITLKKRKIPFLVSKEQLIKLIGNPDKIDESIFKYNLGNPFLKGGIVYGEFEEQKKYMIPTKWFVVP